jgi:hypothetical protein
MADGNKAVQKTQTAIALPQLQDMVTTGFENVGVDDTATPFLKLLQKMSPETEKGTADYYDNSEACGI